MKQCREHNCPLQDICRGAVDNETWWNISENCEIFAFVKAQDDKIFELENRLKECENGYEGTLHLESCKLHDAEEKVKELTEQVESLKQCMEHEHASFMETFGEYSEKCRGLAKENERLKKENNLLKSQYEELYKLAKDLLGG